MRLRPPCVHTCRRARVRVPDLDQPRMGPGMTPGEAAAVGQEEWLLEVSLQQPPEVSLRRLPPFALCLVALEVSLQRHRPFPHVTPFPGVLGVSPKHPRGRLHWVLGHPHTHACARVRSPPVRGERHTCRCDNGA